MKLVTAGEPRNSRLVPGVGREEVAPRYALCSSDHSRSGEERGIRLRSSVAAGNAERSPVVAKVVCVLYPDPVAGYPPKCARDTIPTISRYPNGQMAPTPDGPLGFTPGELVGCVSGELGLRPYLERNGHELIVTSDKDCESSAFDRHLPDADVVISQPFWPAYLTAGAYRPGEEAQAGRHRRNRLRPRQSEGRQPSTESRSPK